MAVPVLLGVHRGRHRRRPAPVTGRPPNARVATGLDAGRFWELIVTAIATLGAD